MKIKIIGKSFINGKIFNITYKDIHKSHIVIDTNGMEVWVEHEDYEIIEP